MEKARLEGRRAIGTQTTIGANYFNKKPGGMTDMGSSRGSGSINSQRTSVRPGGKQVGGGGRIAGKPPAGGMGRGSRAGGDGQSQASKQGLAIDTTSSHNQPSQSQSNVESPGRSQHGRNNLAQNQRSIDSQNRSQMDESVIPTPRILNPGKRNANASGTLPEGKRSMDGVGQKTAADGQELLEHVQSATQSQQFKTMDDSKTQLHDDTASVGLKKNLMTSNSEKADQAPIASPPVAKTPSTGEK